MVYVGRSVIDVIAWKGVSGVWYAEIESVSPYGTIGSGDSQPEAISDLIERIIGTITKGGK
jgi:hypothetical protein